VALQLILFPKLLATPFALELSDVVMKDLYVTLQLEKRSPRFLWADFARISHFVDMSLLDVNSHFSFSLKLEENLKSTCSTTNQNAHLIAANITVKVFLWSKHSVGSLMR